MFWCPPRKGSIATGNPGLSRGGDPGPQLTYDLDEQPDVPFAGSPIGDRRPQRHPVAKACRTDVDAAIFENRLSQYPDAPGPRYAHAHNAWLDWALQLGIGGLLFYVVFLTVLALRALARARAGGVGFQQGGQTLCLLLYIQIYDLANVSTVPITRFGFFMLAVASACLWLATTRAPARASAAPQEA